MGLGVQCVEQGVPGRLLSCHASCRYAGGRDMREVSRRRGLGVGVQTIERRGGRFNECSVPRKAFLLNASCQVHIALVT
jgi:hypothetical protein